MTDYSMATEAVWLQITSGRGPVECQLAVALFAPVIERAAVAAGLHVAMLDAVPGEQRGALLSVIVSLSGRGAVAFAKGWAGSVQWICPSPVRPGHKRKNWFVAVDLLAAPEAGPGKIDPRDVVLEAMRASGPGGQHVNKTLSAVRALHRPTGLVVTAREERSQAMNRKLALARLASELVARTDASVANAEAARWQRHEQLERGNPVRVFVGPEFK